MMTYKTLIVEDDPMVLYINQHYLEKVPEFMFGGSAASASEAMCRLQEESFDLVLVDVHLTSGNGFELVKELRQEAIDTDIIMITAANESQQIQEMLRYGVSDYILKPFDFDRFQQSLQDFAKRQEQLRQYSVFSQDQVDELQGLSLTATAGQEELEKGLTHHTLGLILETLEQISEPFTINDISEALELSHVSIRKYIKYLEEQAIITSHLEYGAVGRPNTYYTKVT